MNPNEKELKRRIDFMKQNGMSNVAIAKRLGIHETTIRRLIK